MQLDYLGKKSEKEILTKAKSLKGSVKNIDNSLLLKGDNFLALSLLLPFYAGKIDLVYIDPPFNTNQIFTIEDERVSTISRKKNAMVAYSDQMTPSEYIEFMRERLILLRELLSEDGSIYLHIDMKMGHYVKIIMDEIFGIDNFKNDITRIKSNPKNFMRKAYGNQKDVIYFMLKTV